MRPRAGFSLVEITIALGIAAFTLAAIAGFFGVTTQSSLDASGDTLLASMTDQVMSDLRSLPFDVLPEADPRGAAPGTLNPNTGVRYYLANFPPASPFPYKAPDRAPNPPAKTEYYFSAEGVLQNGLTSTSHAGAFYHCTVIKTMDPSTKGFDANPKYNRMQTTLRFEWPVLSATKDGGPNVRFVYESIARYF